MSLEKQQNETLLDWKYRLILGKAKEEIEESWKDISDTLHIGLAQDTIRKGAIFLPEFEEYMLNRFKGQKGIEIPSYKETSEINSDGSHKSDKLIRMSEEESKNPENLLKAHGFNLDEWELVNARNSIWNQSADNMLYSSRITVKPLTNGFNMDKFIAKIQNAIKPVVIEQVVTDGERMLEIPLVDMHFGIADAEYYKSTLDEIVSLIRSKKWNTIYIPIGNDLLHVNDFDGKTANGTQIEQVKIEEAWVDAFNFYSEIYIAALENSVNVKSDYVPGNHDKVMTFGFVKSLEQKFPQIEWDTSIKNKKLFTWEEIAIFSTHGDKGQNRLVKALIDEYGRLIAKSKVVEIHTGHLHFEKSKDDHGIVTRTLGTKAITDNWHYENSFVGAVKTFQLFEYTKDKLKTIHYV